MTASKATLSCTTDFGTTIAHVHSTITPLSTEFITGSGSLTANEEVPILQFFKDHWMALTATLTASIAAVVLTIIVIVVFLPLILPYMPIIVQKLNNIRQTIFGGILRRATSIKVRMMQYFKFKRN
uniref:Uncharacterized protein n=1 Tax=Panagrolaimus superbus TaxID=310955 RepID=A0A914XXF2_9BILA